MLLNSLPQAPDNTLHPETLPSSPDNNGSTNKYSYILHGNTSQTINRDSLFSAPESVARGYQKDQTLTPLDFLSTLTSRLVSESVLLNFNYISMHQRCTRLLRALRTEFASEVDQLNRKKGIDSQSKEGQALSRVFVAIVDNFITATRVGNEDREPNGALPPMKRLERVMRPFIEVEGDAEIQAVKRVLTDRSG